MATPKFKTSKSRAASRKAANMKLSAPALTKCSNCGNIIKMHIVCPICGFYKGQQIVDTSTK